MRINRTLIKLSIYKLKAFRRVNDQFLPNRTRDIIFFTAVTLQEIKQFLISQQLTRRCMQNPRTFPSQKK